MRQTEWNRRESDEDIDRRNRGLCMWELVVKVLGVWKDLMVQVEIMDFLYISAGGVMKIVQGKVRMIEKDLPILEPLSSNFFEHPISVFLQIIK